ncbi:5892_t:CDS:2 [Ambispora gerdemannii]|uniref:5892_t:CDS:1 n=1 Tax=Ambispora gerdemannii TaxID=144530 RepID=A0A9N8W310_9GLOM|nr:5892_t:CDS:2 [Ambispora gerdemannii]
MLKTTRQEPVELPPTKKRKKPQKATLIIDEKEDAAAGTAIGLNTGLNTGSMVINAQKVINVSMNGKIKGYVKGALQVLAPDFIDQVELDKGKTVTRTCSIVEIIKRIMSYRVHQYTLIGCEREEGSQDFQLIPTITVHLSIDAIHGLDEEAGYQPPRIIDVNEMKISL